MLSGTVRGSGTPRKRTTFRSAFLSRRSAPALGASGSGLAPYRMQCRLRREEPNRPSPRPLGDRLPRLCEGHALSPISVASGILAVTIALTSSPTART